MAIAVCLAVEVWWQAGGIGRIISFAAIYDAEVFVVVGLRAVVTAFQAAAAWALWRRLPPGPLFGRWALAASAVLLVFELGLRLSPSSITPGLRWPSVIAYGLYAVLSIVVLRPARREKREA